MDEVEKLFESSTLVKRRKPWLRQATAIGALVVAGGVTAGGVTVAQQLNHEAEAQVVAKRVSSIEPEIRRAVAQKYQLSPDELQLEVPADDSEQFSFTYTDKMDSKTYTCIGSFASNALRQKVLPDLACTWNPKLSK